MPSRKKISNPKMLAQQKKMKAAAKMWRDGDRKASKYTAHVAKVLRSGGSGKSSRKKSSRKKSSRKKSSRKKSSRKKSSRKKSSRKRRPCKTRVREALQRAQLL